MTDSVAVFPPGFKLLDDTTGAPVSGGTINFTDASDDTLEVFSDAALTVSLGSTVYTNSDGVPVASNGSSTLVMVYTGTDVYNITFKDSDDNILFGGAFEDLQGALDTSNFLQVGSTSTLSIPVVTKTANYTVVAADRSKLINGNTSGGSFTLTLDAAATLGDNWSVKLRNGGTISGYQLLLSASEAIAFEGQSFTTRALDIGEAMEIVCDGTAFKVVNWIAPLMASKGPGVITIVSRQTIAPSNPLAGTRYIVSGAFSTYSVGDIIESNGVSFNKYTPPTDCGWLAYVQDEDAYYSFQGSAWVCLKATTAQAQAGTDTAAFMTAAAVRASLPARAYGEYTDNVDITTVLPEDDTIPQIGEGVQILTATITLKSTSSRVRYHFNGIVSGGAGVNPVAALFRAGGADAIRATEMEHSRSGGSDTTNRVMGIGFHGEDAPATAGNVIYTVRAGPGAAGTIRFNGTTAARRFGGVAKATLVLEEVFV